MHKPIPVVEQRHWQEVDMNDNDYYLFKYALSVTHSAMLPAKLLYEMGMPVYSRFETADWPNLVTHDELLLVTTDDTGCRECGKPHHMSNN